MESDFMARDMLHREAIIFIPLDLFTRNLLFCFLNYIRTIIVV